MARNFRSPESGDWDGMKIKIQNRTSFSFRLKYEYEHEIQADADESLVDLYEEVVEPNKKIVVASIHLPDALSSGANLLSWFSISQRDFADDSSLSIKIRMVGHSFGAKLFHSISSSPFGALKPEHEWHSGYSTHSSNWTTCFGSFSILFCKKFYGYSLSIQQICLSSSCDEPSSSTNHKKEIVFENQGRSSFLSGLKFSNNPKHMLGRSPFSTEDGRVRPVLSEISLPPTSHWVSSWEIDDYVMGAGESGWLYASSWDGPWSDKPGISSKVRRRKWVRSYTLGASRNSKEITPQQKSAFKHGHVDADIFASADLQGDSTRSAVLDSLWFASEKVRFLEKILRQSKDWKGEKAGPIRSAILSKKSLVRKYSSLIDART